MFNTIKTSCLLRLLILFGISVLDARRSIHRTRDTQLPTLITRWEGDSVTHTLVHTHITYDGIFTDYKPQYLRERLLPIGKILSHNGEKVLGYGQDIEQALQKTIAEVQQSDTSVMELSEAIILKQRNYNPKQRSGLIVVRLKKYPLVAKIFMETPETFVKPFSKGLEPCCFFVMGGGMSRYLAGFTRIENAERVRAKLLSDPIWGDRVKVPRKWFWQPPGVRFFEVTGKNLRGAGSSDKALFPSIYVVVADAFDSPPCRLSRSQQRKDALALCRFLGTSVDPHINNFLYEDCTGHIVLIDTEHFARLAGLEDGIEFRSYAHYYAALSRKCFTDMFFTQRKRDSFF